MSFRWPLNNVRITQNFGGNAEYYKKYGQNGHNGVDMGAPAGTEVYAADEGTVAFEGWGKSGASGFAGWMGDPAGICIIINHIGSYAGYAHLTKTLVNAGQKVAKGTLIGYVGATGAATGPHLHFEMLPLKPNFKNGYAGRINPTPYIEANNLATVDQIKQAYRDILEREADAGGIATYSKQTNEFTRQDLANSQEKRTLEARKAEASRLAAEQAAATAAQQLAEATKAAETKKAEEAARKAEEARLAAEAELARIAEEERLAREAAEKKAREQKEIEDKAKEANMTTVINQQEKVQKIATDVAGSEVVQNIVSKISPKTKFIVYVVGDSLIGLGLIVPGFAVVAGWTDLIRIVALSSLLATAGGFVLTMFGIYKSNNKEG